MSVTIAIPRGSVACPVAALNAWLDASGISKGPLFRPIAKGGNVRGTRPSSRSVAKIVKAHAAELALFGKTWGSFAQVRIPDERRSTRCFDLQTGRSVPAQVDGSSYEAMRETPSRSRITGLALDEPRARVGPCQKRSKTGRRSIQSPPSSPLLCDVSRRPPSRARARARRMSS